MTLNGTLVLLAAWVQGTLALALLGRMGTIRIPLIAKGEISIAAMALSREPWPDREKQVSNAFDNQFQLPVLFYVASFMALWLSPTLFEVALAVAFVASRLVHAFIHITSNNVVVRFSAYVTGLAIIAVWWVDLLVRLVLTAMRGGI